MYITEHCVFSFFMSRKPTLYLNRCYLMLLLATDSSAQFQIFKHFYPLNEWWLVLPLVKAQDACKAPSKANKFFQKMQLFSASLSAFHEKSYSHLSLSPDHPPLHKTLSPSRGRLSVGVYSFCPWLTDGNAVRHQSELIILSPVSESPYSFLSFPQTALCPSGSSIRITQSVVSMTDHYSFIGKH